MVLWLSVGLSLLAFSTALAVAVNTEGGPLSDGPRISDLDLRLRRLEERFGRVEAVVGPSRMTPLDAEGGTTGAPRSRLDLRISLLEQQLTELEDRVVEDPAQQRLERLLRQERVRELRAEREAAARAVRDEVLDADLSLDDRADAYRRLLEAGVPTTAPVDRAMLALFDGVDEPTLRARLALVFDGVRDPAVLGELRKRMEAASEPAVAEALRAVLEAAELAERTE